MGGFSRWMSLHFPKNNSLFHVGKTTIKFIGESALLPNNKLPRTRFRASFRAHIFIFIYLFIYHWVCFRMQVRLGSEWKKIVNSCKRISEFFCADAITDFPSQTLFSFPCRDFSELIYFFFRFCLGWFIAVLTNRNVRIRREVYVIINHNMLL